MGIHTRASNWMKRLHTCRINIPKAAIAPDVTVHAWRTALLEGKLSEFCITSTLLLLSKEDPSDKILFSSSKLLRVDFNAILFGDCTSLLSFFTDFCRAKVLVQNLLPFNFKKTNSFVRNCWLLLNRRTRNSILRYLIWQVKSWENHRS